MSLKKTKEVASATAQKAKEFDEKHHVVEKNKRSCKSRGNKNDNGFEISF